MCFTGGPGYDNSADVARHHQEVREDRIDRGKQRIDQQFSVFDPEYFKKLQGDYTNYYDPQVDKQFGDARQKLKYNLSRAGIEDATAGNKAFGRLADSYGDQRRAIADKALEASNSIRGQVEQNKSQLYAQNTSAADPSLAAVSAVSSANSLQSPPAFTPLGDLFSGLVNSGAYYLYGQNKAMPRGYGSTSSQGLPGSGSGYVVGG